MDKFQTLNKLASFHFTDIKFEYECDPDPQLCSSVSIFVSMLTLVSLPDLDQTPEPILVLVPIELEIKPPILKSHIPLMRKEYELHFFDLDPTFEPNPTLESKLDLSHILESVSFIEPFTLKPKSTITPSHILLVDQGIDYYDCQIIFQDWSYNWDDFNDRIVHDSIQLGEVTL